MKIELKPGEAVTVTLEGTDGEIVVAFGEDDVRVTADMPDSSGREGVIYLEAFGDEPTGAAPGPIVIRGNELDKPYTVHILHHAYPLCHFSSDVPRDWPEGHRWSDTLQEASCSKCIEEYKAMEDKG